jgi:thiol:disulfide interchange protein DsbD
LAAGVRAEGPHVRAELLAEPPAVKAGVPFWVGVRLTHAPGWHTYTKDPGDSGLPTKIDWRLPPGFSAGEIQWPVAKRIETPPLVNFGYEGVAVLLVQITPPKKLAGNSVELKAKVTWLECMDTCIPGQAELALSVPVEGKSPPNDDNFELFEEARARLTSAPADAAPAQPDMGIWLALALAFVGGILLNLMPCVLPVLSIKFLGFLDTPRDTLRAHGILYGAGVLASFLALAGLLIALRAGGEKLGWGFQLQSPVFVGLLAALFFALGLNLLGVFEIGTSLVGLGGLSGQNAFLSGVLAVVVATPCTAPFMGPALGYALTLPAVGALAIFTALAVGLALPYVAVSFFPAALRCLPKPGAWMETMKQAFAFLFFGTCVWLVWVLGLQRGVGVVAAALTVFLGLALGAWLAGPVASRQRTDGRRTGLRRVGALVALASAAGVLAFGQPDIAAKKTNDYSPERVQEALAQGKSVFVDFTAAWCITCQVNERTTLSSTAVQEAFLREGVMVLTADWTRKDPVITRALELFGRNGVPLYVLYRPGKEPTILPTLLTPEIVIKALEE